MNREQLKKMLTERNVAPSRYELDGRPADDAFVLEERGDGWRVFYAERGGEDDERLFASEDEACQYIFDHLKDMESAKVDAVEKHPYRGK